MKTLVVLAHPAPDSLCGALATAYADAAARTGAQVEVLRLGDLEFDALGDPRPLRGHAEPDVLRSQELIAWCDHLVLVFPTWWGTYPAVLKGWIDRVFEPGFAFEYLPSGLPKKLLKGRTARIVTTMGSPSWWYRLVYGSCGIKAIKAATLEFCGFGSVKTTLIPHARMAAGPKVESWRGTLGRLAATDAAGRSRRQVGGGAASRP